MIDVIGFKRALILFVLFAICLVITVANYMYLAPENVSLERELKSVQSRITKKVAEKNKIENDLDAINLQKEDFKQLEAIGLLDDQNRLAFRRRINNIQQYTGVLSAEYGINAGNIKPQSDLEAAGHVILESPIDVKLDAIDDVDVYKFIFWLKHGFPGHVALDDISIERKRDIDEDVIKEITTSGPTALIEASLKARLRTIVPQENAPSDNMGRR